MPSGPAPKLTLNNKALKELKEAELAAEAFKTALLHENALEALPIHFAALLSQLRVVSERGRGAAGRGGAVSWSNGRKGGGGKDSRER